MTQVLSSKLCSKCKVEKPIDQFHRNQWSVDGYQHHCKECRHAAKVAKWKDTPTQSVTRVRNGKPQTYTRRQNHGESRTQLYRRWKGFRERCNNPKAHNYRWYGGRGIVVCEEWNTNFFAFKEWALNNGYSPELELDRINNDGPYSPDNCRWVTKLTNKETRAAYLSPEMETKVKERAEKDGVSIHTVIKSALEAYL